MLVTELYDGQGFGNQLWSYVFIRVAALDRGLDFGIQNAEKFKGKDFLKVNFGQKVLGGSGPEGGPPTQLPNGIDNYYSERVIRHPTTNVDIRTIDLGFQNLTDSTKIDGIFQAEEYIAHRKDEIRDWLAYDKARLDSDFDDENVCVINFRGGEYRKNPKIFLRRKYWTDAVNHVRRINPKAKFIVITDDPRTAAKFFPKFPIRHYGIHGDYQAINTAPYLILSNSSFAFFPAWLNVRLRVCIAPKFWSAHNESDGYWGCSYNIVRGWKYLDRKGLLFSYQECVNEFDEFKDHHWSMYEQKRIADATVVVSSFDNDLSWLPRYSDNYFVFEQGRGSGIPSQLDRKRVAFVTHSGSNLRDYFNYIVNNYENLPDVLFLVKGNIFPRHVDQTIFDQFVSRTDPCGIVDRKKLRTRFPISFIDRRGRYCELNSDWFMDSGIPWKYFDSQNAFFRFFAPSLPRRFYVRFSPGAQYITTREVIQRIPKEVYEDLRETVTHSGFAVGYTSECYLVERGLERLWENSPLAMQVRDPHLKLVPSRSPRKPNSLLVRALLAVLHHTSKIIGFATHSSSLVSRALLNRLKLKRNYLS